MAGVHPFVFDPEMAEPLDVAVENLNRLLCNRNIVLTNDMLSNAIQQLVVHEPLTNDEYVNTPFGRTIVYYPSVLNMSDYPNLQNEVRNIGYRFLAIPMLSRQNAAVVEEVNQPRTWFRRDPFNNNSIEPLPIESVQVLEYVFTPGSQERVPVHPAVTHLSGLLSDIYRDLNINDLYDYIDALPVHDERVLNELTPVNRLIFYDARVFNNELFPTRFQNIVDILNRYGYELVSRPYLERRDAIVT